MDILLNVLINNIIMKKCINALGNQYNQFSNLEKQQYFEKFPFDIFIFPFIIFILPFDIPNLNFHYAFQILFLNFNIKLYYSILKWKSHPFFSFSKNIYHFVFKRILPKNFC